MALVTSLLVLAPTFFMLEVYDRVLNSRNSTTLGMLLLLVLGAYVVMELLDLVRGALLAQAARQVDESLRGRLFDAAFAGSLLRGPRAGGTQAFADLKTLVDFIPSPAVTALLDSPASLVFLAIVFAISPLLGVVALVGAAVQVLIAWRTERSTMPALTAANRAAIEAQVYANGAMRNTLTIQAMGMLPGVRRRWMQAQRKFLQLQADASERNGLNTAGSRLVQTLQGSLLLGASCWLSLRGDFAGSGGLMIVVSTLGGRILAPLAQLVAQWRSVVQVRDAVNRLNELLAASPPVPDTMPLPAPRGRLTVEQVVASPPDSQAIILRGVSLVAQPGEVLVVVGPSGSGKSTLARLLTGVWPAKSGKVRLDGADVYDWNKDELGPHVGYLAQGVDLFDGTLAENIARFGSVDMGQVRAAADMVGLSDTINTWPDGFDTRVGDGGAFLSGGIRQRVGLARALYGQPRLVMLDEPNASLDEAGDAALAQALQRMKLAGATLVVMSHRTSILPVADRLLVMQDGAVALFGPRDEVLGCDAAPGGTGCGWWAWGWGVGLVVGRVPVHQRAMLRPQPAAPRWPWRAAPAALVPAAQQAGVASHERRAATTRSGLSGPLPAGLPA